MWITRSNSCFNCSIRRLVYQFFTLKKQHIRNAVIISLVLAPFVLLFFPANYFDTGKTICPSKRILNMDCLGCGLTRSTQHLLHLEFKKAWEYNKLIIIVFPVMVYYWIKGLFFIKNLCLNLKRIK